MTPDRQRGVARAGSRIAAVIVAACAAIMIGDYVAARTRASADAERVATLQRQAQTDASFASKLAAEQDRITRARHARKARSGSLSILLIAAAAAFVASEKWLVALDRRRPVVATIPLASLRVLSVPTTPVAVKPSAQTPATVGIDLTFVDRVVEKEGRSREAAIPILQAIQSHYRYLPDEALQRVCELTDVTPAQIAGTSSFYARFRRSPVGEHVIRVCHGTACHVSGARQITEELRRQLRIPPGADTDPERMFTLDEVACLGCCSLAPVLMVDDHTAGRLTPATASAALDFGGPTQPT